MIEKVTCAVDCGEVVNPNVVEAQMMSGIHCGVSSAMFGEVTITKGRVDQGNFDTYRFAKMAEMPPVETHIIRSGEAMGGVGEPGTPPLAPALCNAIFAATGKRIRQLPIQKALFG